MAESSNTSNFSNELTEGFKGNSADLKREKELQMSQKSETMQQGSGMDYDCLVQLLTDLVNNTGMPILEENGQRKFGPPMGFVGPRPPLSSEVYVGNLPKDCYEPELFPIFNEVGRIFEMRLMMDFNRTTRGYCFIQYFNDLDAEKAIRELHNFEIRKGRYLTVVHSTSKRTLYLRNLPKKKTRRDITFLIGKLASGVVAVTVPPPRIHQRGNKNRGYCFVEFESHSSALSFLTRWCKHQIKVYTDEVTIQWADTVPPPNSIIVYDLAPTTTKEKILATFNEVSDNGVERIEKRADGVYVFFKTSGQAKTAKNVLHYTNLEGATIKIKMDTVTSRNSMTNENNNCQLQLGHEHAPEFYPEGNTEDDENVESQFTNNNNINPTRQLHASNISNDVHSVFTTRNQNQALVSENFPGPSCFSDNPQIPSRGIFLYGPYYPPPVYMMPVQFVSGWQQPN